MKKVLTKIFIVTAALFIGFAIYNNNLKKKQIAEFGVYKGEKIYKFFATTHKESEITPLKAIKGDINGDDKDDLIVVFNKKGSDSNSMVVVYSDSDALKLTKEVKAPKENIELKIKDIDNTSPNEIIVSGSKNGNYGYGIFRLINNNLKDLFGENMKNCC